MPRLEFIGREVIRRDPMQLLDVPRAKYCATVSERGIQEIAAREFQRGKQRNSAMVAHLFGRAILIDDLTTIEAWPMVDPNEKRVLERLTPAQREKKVGPEGLSKTYVWRKSNGWVQDVTEADA